MEAMSRLVSSNQQESNMQRALLNRATMRVADTTEVSDRVTADQVNLDRFHNRIGKVGALVVARSKVYLSAATMILIVTLAVPAVAQNQVPFKGAIQGYESDTPHGGPPPTTVLVVGLTTGVGTLVGQLTFSYELTVTLPGFTATGSGKLIAANGDIINTTITGFLVPPASPPGVASITEFDTITGGTGRFTGATGQFRVDRLLNQVGGNPHLTSGLDGLPLPACRRVLGSLFGHDPRSPRMRNESLCLVQAGAFVGLLG
jgi:hypothetical protein